MAKKPLITTTVTVHDVQGTIVFADAITDGVTVRYGSIARQQILNGETIDSVGTWSGETGAIVIPYHAIIKADISESEGTFTKPDDAFCKAE